MRHLLAVQPGHLDGTVQLATALMEQGGMETEARQLYLQALTVDPLNTKTLRHLGINLFMYYCVNNIGVTVSNFTL